MEEWQNAGLALPDLTDAQSQAQESVLRGLLRTAMELLICRGTPTTRSGGTQYFGTGNAPFLAEFNPLGEFSGADMFYFARRLENCPGWFIERWEDERSSR